MTCCHCSRFAVATMVRVVRLSPARRVVEHWCIRCYLRECAPEGSK